MADSAKRSQASGKTELERSQLTLDDWIDALRTTPTKTPARGHATRDVAAASVLLSEGESSSCAGSSVKTAPHRRSATELLQTPGALLTRSHLRELGLERRAVDAVFRALAVVFLPGYSRPMVRVEDFLELVEQFTYGDDRVRPIAKAS
ncbi:MAG: hypothetical protein ACRDQT_12615 [Gaiellaceae bacterium]